MLTHLSMTFHSLRPGPRSLAIAAVVLANVIWGTTFVATKPVLAHLPPLTVATLRFAVALLALLVVLGRKGARPAFGRPVALLGFTGVFLVYACQNIGLKYTSATNGALIHGGIPVFTALLAVPLLGERRSGARLAGIMVSLAGVGGVIAFGARVNLGFSLAGDTLVLASAVSLALYLIIGRRITALVRSPLEAMAGAMCYGLLFLVPASAVELALNGASRPGPADLSALLYLGIAASALAFVLWGYGLRHLEAGQAALATSLSPLVGLVAAAVVLGEPITTVQLGGGVLILSGMWLSWRADATSPRRGRAGAPVRVGAA